MRIEDAGEVSEDLGAEGGWLADGFVWTDNAVPQRYLVQVAWLASGALHVERMIVNEGTLDKVVQIERAERLVVIVAALADHTTERAPYLLQLAEAPAR